MIQRAVTAIIGVVIGLFATFAVFGAILGGLDNFYLLTQSACNYGTESAPERFTRGVLPTSGLRQRSGRQQGDGDPYHASRGCRLDRRLRRGRVSFR